MAGELPPLPPGFVLDTPPLPPGFTLDGASPAQEPAQAPPRTLSEGVWDRIRQSRAETGLSFGGQIGEGMVSIVGGMGSMAASGIAGLTRTGYEAIASKSPEGFRTAPGRTETIEKVQQKGHELFGAETAGGQAVGEGLAKGVGAVGTAIKYPLSAVPFFMGPEGEREKFMEMPMSQYLGELAQDNGASPLVATLSHMLPDLALTATAAGGASKAKAGAKAQPKPPTIDELKAQSSALYDVVDNAGVRISDEAFSQAVTRITEDFLDKGGRQSLTPKTWSALEELGVEVERGGLTLKKSEELRRVLNKAKSSSDRADAASAARAVNQWDRFIENLNAGQLSNVAGGESVEFLKSARELWSRSRKSEIIDELIRKANREVQSQTGMSGLSHQLRLKFKQLANNDKKMRLFTPQERQLIELVARGDKIERIARVMGKFAVKNPWDLAGGLASGGGLAYAFGAAPGAVGPIALAVPLVGSLSKRFSNLRTKKFAGDAQEAVLRGKPLVAQP